MNRITQAIARLLTPWRTIRQLEREVKRLEGVIANPYLAGLLQIGRETGIEFGCRGSGPQLLAGLCQWPVCRSGGAAMSAPPAMANHCWLEHSLTTDRLVLRCDRCGAIEAMPRFPLPLQVIERRINDWARRHGHCPPTPTAAAP